MTTKIMLDKGQRTSLSRVEVLIVIQGVEQGGHVLMGGLGSGSLGPHLNAALFVIQDQHLH